MADDAAPLLRGSRQESWDVDEGDERDVERVARADETRALDGGVDVENPGERAGLIAHHSHGMAVQARKAADEVLGPALVHLEELTIVDHVPHDLLHVVGLGRIVGDQGVQLRFLAVRGISRFEVGRRIEVVLREEREQVARVLETGFVARRDEVRHARLGRVRCRAAELLEGHLLAGDRLHHVGPGDEHVGAALHHQDEVGDRGRIDGAAGARAHDQAELRDHAGALDVPPEDVRIARERDDPFLDPGTTRVVDPDHRAAVLRGHVHHLADLLREDLGEAAAEDGEVLREDEHAAAEDRPVPGHDGVAVRPLLPHPELRLAVADVAVELDERARVD